MVLQSVSRDDSVGFCKTKNVNKQKPLLNRKLIKRTILAMIFENVKKIGQCIFKIKLVQLVKSFGHFYLFRAEIQLNIFKHYLRKRCVWSGKASDAL